MGRRRRLPYPKRLYALASGFPVDRRRASAVVDEAGEISAVEPGAVSDDQPGGGLERVDALGGGAERRRERRDGHESPSPAACRL
jgi:hypothetical protein